MDLATTVVRLQSNVPLRVLAWLFRVSRVCLVVEKADDQ